MGVELTQVNSFTQTQLSSQQAHSEWHKYTSVKSVSGRQLGEFPAIDLLIIENLGSTSVASRLAPLPVLTPNK